MVAQREAEYRDADAQLGAYTELAAQLRALAAAAAAAAPAQHGDATPLPPAAAAAPVKLLADVGAGHFMHARVSDPSRVLVHVGCGVYPELRPAEAAAYVGSKVEGLRRCVEGEGDGRTNERTTDTVRAVG